MSFSNSKIPVTIYFNKLNYLAINKYFVRLPPFRTGFSVENAFLDEKEEAVLALKQICEHTGPAFSPFIQPCFEAIYKLLDHPTEDIRKVAIDALTQFIIALHNMNDAVSVRNAVQIFVPKIAELIKNDEDCQTVITGLESFSELLKTIKSVAIESQAQKTAIFDCVLDVLNSKVTCQFDDNVNDGDEVDESEYDEALIDIAGDIIPKFGAALSPDEFALYFGRVWSLLAKKIVSISCFAIVWHFNKFFFLGKNTKQ